MAKEQPAAPQVRARVRVWVRVRVQASRGRRPTERLRREHRLHAEQQGWVSTARLGWQRVLGWQ
eukprot:scaffold18076_cov33-Phaeocystis_antarctica.AAC.6